MKNNNIWWLKIDVFFTKDKESRMGGCLDDGVIRLIQLSTMFKLTLRLAKHESCEVVPL